MSTLDITRFLQQPLKHYSGVRLQQGRILTDADFNEGAYLGEGDHRAVLFDLIGPRGSPDQGFTFGGGMVLGQGVVIPLPLRRIGIGDSLQTVVPLAITSLAGESVQVRPFSIHAGTFYVGGMRFELGRHEPFMFQRDFLQMKKEDIPVLDQNAVTTFRRLFYIHAWEQYVSPVEDPEFLETALGGVDTSVRLRHMRRVEVRDNIGDGAPDCETAWRFVMDTLQQGGGKFNRATGELVSNGRLQLSTQFLIVEPDCTVCNPDPGARFLGADNQTLRIMLTGENRLARAETFVWALDNGAPLHRIKVTGLETVGAEIEVELLTPPRDEQHWPLAGRVVEILPFSALLDGPTVGDPAKDPHFNKVADEIGAFLRVKDSFNPNTGKFTVEPGPGLERLRKFAFQWNLLHPDARQLFVPPEDPNKPGDVRYFYARFWHTAFGPDDIEIKIDGFEDALGDTGLVPVFHEKGRPGDFWIATLRPGIDNPIVPFEIAANENGVPPDGPRHFYAPLALMQAKDGFIVEYEDCRRRIRPLNDDACITFTVGDGVCSKGDFRSIQQAIDSLPGAGGTVLVLRGLYEQQVVIEDRKNVTLLGCGEETVLQSPQESHDDGVVRIVGSSEGITVGTLALHAMREPCVFADGCTDLTLAGLLAVTSSQTSGPFKPFSGDSNSPRVPLVQITHATGVRVTGLGIRSGRDTALFVNRSDDVTVTDLEATAEGDKRRRSRRPMVRFEGCHLVRVARANLRALGQFGLQIVDAEPDVSTGGETVRRSTDVELDELDVFSDVSEIKQVGSVVIRNACSTVDIDGDRVELKNSRLRLGNHTSEHAVVVAGGTDVTVEGNVIEAELPNDPKTGPNAWGGVQVRGGSTAVTIRNNRIRGGCGHGVTLGSLLWPTDLQPAPLRLGAGFEQMAFREDGNRATGTPGLPSEEATDEGVLTDIVISGNRIEGMSANGISTIYAYRKETLDLIEVVRIVIHDNVIIDNLRFPYETVDTTDPLPFSTSRANSARFPIPVLPFAGIMLSAVHGGADIRGNVIEGNGATASAAKRLPFNGIFILTGDGIAITGNRIENNGATTNTVPKAGIRAGIAVLFAGSGQTETIAGLRAQIVAGLLASLEDDGSSLRVIDNVVRQPLGRALEVAATGPVIIQGNMLASDSFHGSANQDERTGTGDVVFVANFGAPWETHDIGQLTTVPPGSTSPYGSFAGFDTPREAFHYLRNNVTRSPRQFIAVDGRIQFHNNHVIYDWEVSAKALGGARQISSFGVALLSLDHVSVVGNTFGQRLRNVTHLRPNPDFKNIDQMLSQVFTAGATVEISHNRVASAIGAAFASILSMADLMGVVTFNQGTHFILDTVRGEATASTPLLKASVGNQVMAVQKMFPPSGTTPLSQDDLFNLTQNVALLFLQVLFQRSP